MYSLVCLSFFEWQLLISHILDERVPVAHWLGQDLPLILFQPLLEVNNVWLIFSWG